MKLLYAACTALSTLTLMYLATFSLKVESQLAEAVRMNSIHEETIKTVVRQQKTCLAEVTQLGGQ